MSGLSYKEHLLTLKPSFACKCLTHADLIKYWKIFHSRCSISPEDLFNPALYSYVSAYWFKITHE